MVPFCVSHRDGPGVEDGQQLIRVRVDGQQSGFPPPEVNNQLLCLGGVEDQGGFFVS